MPRLLLLLSLLCLAVLPASAMAKRTTKFAVTSTANSIASKEAPTLLAGDLKGTFGTGAVVIRVKTAKGDTATATFTLFTERGVLKGTTTFTFSASGPVGAGGETKLQGTGKITGGTGSYEQAKGSFTVSGISPVGENFYKLKLTGSFTRP